MPLHPLQSRVDTSPPLPRPPTAVVRAVYATSRQNPGLFHREAKRASIAERRVLVQFWGLAELRRCLAYPCRRPPSSPAFAPSPTKSRPDTPDTKIKLRLLWCRGAGHHPLARHSRTQALTFQADTRDPPSLSPPQARVLLCAPPFAPLVHADAHTRPVESDFRLRLLPLPQTRRPAGVVTLRIQETRRTEMANGVDTQVRSLCSNISERSHRYSLCLLLCSHCVLCSGRL